MTNVLQGTQPKTCILFCNIDARRVELRCCAFYHLRIKPVLQQIRLAGSLCTDAPPPLRKNREEWRLWIFFVNRVPVYICISYYYFCFPFDNWKGVERLTRLWTLVQHVRSYYFFLRWGGVCTQATRMDMDWNLRKLSQLFQVLMRCLQKSPKKDHA